MGIDEQAFGRLQYRLSVNNPGALPVFRELTVRVSAVLGELGAIELNNIFNLALLSQKRYISDHIILSALQKGELNHFCFLLDGLAKQGYPFVVVFLNYYPSLTLPLGRIGDDILALSLPSLLEFKKSEKVLEFCFSQPAHELPHLLKILKTYCRTFSRFPC